MKLVGHSKAPVGKFQALFWAALHNQIAPDTLVDESKLEYHPKPSALNLTSPKPPNPNPWEPEDEGIRIRDMEIVLKESARYCSLQFLMYS